MVDSAAEGTARE